MELIFTGPNRDAFRLRRILRDDDIDVVVMTAPNHPSGAVFVPAEAAEKSRLTLDRAIERVQTERAARGDGGANEDTPQRAPDALYWRAWEAMRAAHARIEPFEQTDSPFDDEDVEWAAAEGLDKLNTVMQAIQDEHGTRRHALEQVTEKALALLTGLRAIALVLRNPLADNRAMIRATDPDKHFEAITAIGYLLMQLRDLAPDGAPAQWMRRDARGLMHDDAEDTEGRKAA